MTDREVPAHVAIILDGNGRWAKKRGMPRTYGHTMGAKNVEKICRSAHAIGIRYLTFYAFSTENWSRPPEEVAALMKLLEQYLHNCRELARKNDMRVRMIGDRTGLRPSMREAIDVLERESEGYQGLNLTIALNYGSRDEIVRAVRRLVTDVRAGDAPADIDERITEETLSSYLDTGELPDPDLVIRTSGEQRLSNFLLWQLAYAEMYFTPVPWPDFKDADLREAVRAYQERDRRYGKV